MKSVFYKYLSIVFSILVACSCHREGPDCHHNIIFRNTSEDTLIYALRGTIGNGLCALGVYSELARNEQTTLDLSRYCWEQELSKGKTAEMYVVDPVKFNKSGTFFSCDSIEIKNKVLRHYELTLDDLKENNFVITYP